MSETIDAASAYEKFLPAAMALASQDVRPYRLDADLAMVNVQTSRAAVKALEGQIAAHLPLIDLPRVLSIAELAAAVKFADLRAEQAVPAQKGIREALAKARATRRLLLATTRALVESECIAQEKLAPILEGSGSRDIAEDCVALADLLHTHESSIAGKHALTKEQINEAASVGSWLLANMRKKDAPSEKAGEKTTEVDARDRLGTLLVNTYADLRRIAYYFHGDQFDEIVPPLQSRNIHRAAKSADAHTP